MARTDDAFQPDFFNNITAVAVVLMFTKVVAHRMHDGDRKRGSAVLHVIAVSAAAIAAGTSIVATERSSNWCILHLIVWLGLGTACALLLVEIVIDDVGGPWGWRRRRGQTCVPQRR